MGQGKSVERGCGAGVGPERLVFAKKVPHSEYLAQFKCANLYLDTFNYNAGATASNALWAGLPVVTKQGKCYAARMASSLLKSVGLTELITTSESEYENLAMKLAQDPQQIAALQQKLSANRITRPLFNSSYSQNIWKMVTSKLMKGTATEITRCNIRS